jgi:hypothetical protein
MCGVADRLPYTPSWRGFVLDIKKHKPREVAKITDCKTSKSQQKNRVLLGVYAVVIY